METGFEVIEKFQIQVPLMSIFHITFQNSEK